MSICRHYLSRILGRVKNSTPHSLLRYRCEVRLAIGRVLTETENLGSPSLYVPIFSQINLTKQAGRVSEVYLISL